MFRLNKRLIKKSVKGMLGTLRSKPVSIVFEGLWTDVLL